MRAPLRGRRDKAEPAIASALTRAGASLDYVEGRPYDLVVGFRGRTFLLEIKSPRGRLRPSQRAYQALWRGHYAVVRSVNEALAAIGAVDP